MNIVRRPELPPAAFAAFPGVAGQCAVKLLAQVKIGIVAPLTPGIPSCPAQFWPTLSGVRGLKRRLNPTRISLMVEGLTVNDSESANWCWLRGMGVGL